MVKSENLAITVKEIYPSLLPEVDYSMQNDHDGTGAYFTSWDNPEPEPTQSEIDAAVPAALASLKLDELKLYAEESGLRYGCGIIDPLTGEPSGDSSAPIHVIRQQTGQARNHLVYLKLDGTEAQKVSASNCQAVEENLSLVVAQTIVDIQAGTITTESEIDARISAVVITY